MTSFVDNRADQRKRKGWGIVWDDSHEDSGAERPFEQCLLSIDPGQRACWWLCSTGKRPGLSLEESEDSLRGNSGRSDKTVERECSVGGNLRIGTPKGPA